MEHRHANSRATLFVEDGKAVSDIIGSILLVAITVLMAGALGFMLLAFAGPEPTVHAELSISVDPGTSGWGTGDESVRILHRGGDPLSAAQTTVHIRTGGTTVSLSGDALGSAWSDGRLSIGQTWLHTLTLQSGAPVQVSVVSTPGGQATLLSREELVADSVSTSQPCLSDDNPPTVLLWTQNPATLTATYTGAVTVTAQLHDDCWGVNPSVVPNLYWRLGTTGPFTDTGAMTSAGINRWVGAIAGPGQTWTAGQTLQYYVGNVTDLGGNTGPTPTQSTLILSDCGQDNVPPTAPGVSQNPTDVRTDTTGGVAVTVVATDDCAGVDPNQLPVLRFRVNDGSNPSYTAAAPLNRTVSNPCCTWVGTIPDQGWANQGGKTLNYYVDSIRDLNGNLGSSPVQSDLIQPIHTYTYCASNTAVVGTVSAFSNACGAAAGSDSGAEATLAEAASSPSPSTQLFNANGVITSNGWTAPGNVFASDDGYATFATDNPTASHDLRASLQQPVVQTGTITQVRLFGEVRVQGNDGWFLMGCLAGGSCTALSGTLGMGIQTDSTITYDISAIRPGGGAWTWSDISNLQIIVRPQQQGARDGTWFVDRLWADVTATVSTYSMNIRFEWNGVPSGSGARVLDLQYRTTGDTFQVEVCQDSLIVCASWTQRGTLSSASSASFTYTLTESEFRLSGGTGAPRIRFVDSNPTGNIQGNLHLDWARVNTL